MRGHSSYLFSTLFVAFLGAVAVFACFTWIEWKSERETSVRSSDMVLADVEQAIVELRAEGVYWFTASREDARQLEAIIDLLEPSLHPFHLRVHGFDGFALVSAQHPDFDNGWMSLRETENSLIALRPTE
jgi:hypothetical protein